MAMGKAVPDCSEPRHRRVAAPVRFEEPSGVCVTGWTCQVKSIHKQQTPIRKPIECAPAASSAAVVEGSGRR